MSSVSALSWKIATEPKLYRELASNPYSPKALQIISERFPHTSAADIIRAVILAELEGKYDRDFKKLPKAKQEEELSKQKNLSDEIDKRLLQYCKKNAKEFSRLPKKSIYTNLSGFVFGIDNLKEINQKYAQNQRRDIKLSIVNFIENNKKPPPKQSLLKIALATLSLIFLFSFQIQNASQHPKVRKQILGIKAQRVSQGLPVRLIIPAINVDANIQHLGVTQGGEMEVPDNSVDVGWFKLGSIPGEKGSAVIAGHFDGKSGETGVFTNLHKLKKGDKLYVQDEKGISTSFVVREMRTYDPGYADEVFSSNDNGAHLNLVTCDGVWDKNKKSYGKRLVVFADITH